MTPRQPEHTTHLPLSKNNLLWDSKLPPVSCNMSYNIIIFCVCHAMKKTGNTAIVTTFQLVTLPRVPLPMLGGKPLEGRDSIFSLFLFPSIQPTTGIEQALTKYSLNKSINYSINPSKEIMNLRMEEREAVMKRRKGTDNKPVPHPSKSLVPGVKLIAMMSNLF